MANCELRPLDQSLRQEVVRMIAAAFAVDDPLARSRGISATEFKDLIDRLYDDLVASGLSFVAFDSDSQRVAAVVLAEPHRNEAGEEASDAIAAIISAARESYFTDYDPASGELMHIHFIASDPDYRGQQLVQKLIASCLQQARDRGFQRAVVEASGIRSRTLLEKHLGFQPRVTIGYADFEWRGELPFRSIADHDGLTLMERQL